MKQRFHPDQKVLGLMESFRQMTNISIRIGIENDASSLKSLSVLSYKELSGFKLPSAYKLCAISKAAGVLAHYRKLSKRHHVRRPYCTKLNLTTCYALKVRDGDLLMPGLEVPLNRHVQRFLAQPDVEIRSVNLTPELLSISVRKHVLPMLCIRMVGIDSNRENVTLADTEHHTERYDLSEATEAKLQCREIEQRFRRNDVRVRRRILQKYGRLEKNRVGWLLHNVSANIVLQAKRGRKAIVMEDLRGIRKLYRKGKGQGSRYRSKMNSWSFAELQRQVHYKAEWNGIPVIYVKPAGTSAKCSMCGHPVLPEENRQLHCPNCGLTIDRDVNAARNILARGLRFKPVGSADEAMVAELAQQQAVICKVDADQSNFEVQQ